MLETRDEIIEAAKNWLEANTPIRWVTEAVGVEKDIPLEESNARPQRRAEWLADFALSREIELRLDRRGEQSSLPELSSRRGRMEVNMIKTTAQLQQRFVEISEDNSFPKNFGTGENLIGLPPNDIYQLGFAAAFFECNRAVNQYVNGQAEPSMPDDGC